MKITDLSISKRRKIKDLILSYSSLWSHRVVINYCEKYGCEYILEINNYKGEDKPTSHKLYMGLLEEFMGENYELLNHILEVMEEEDDELDEDGKGDDYPF